MVLSPSGLGSTNRVITSPLADSSRPTAALMCAGPSHYGSADSDLAWDWLILVSGERVQVILAAGGEKCWKIGRFLKYSRDFKNYYKIKI